ncbi:MAG: DNA translocase FtsK 4TM domain-containing protein [Bacteroidetes bacterium]|nr:DNA translocase FtsK 4TM domain-containing protein [Bacteroidota bacterium]
MAEKENETLKTVRNEFREKKSLKKPEKSEEDPGLDIEEEEEKKTRSRKKDTEPEKKNSPKEKKNTESAPRRKKGNPIANFITRLRTDQKLHRITGAFLVFIIAPYLTVAFVSYFFSWQTDQDKVMGPLGTLLASDVSVSNVLGKLGALISHIFIHNWFGVTSFFFPMAGFVLGLRLLAHIRLLPLRKTFSYGIYALLFGSILLGFVFKNKFFFPGGVFGFESSSWLNSVVGPIGTGLLLAFSLLVFLIVNFNLSFAWLKKKEPEVVAESELAAEENDLKNSFIIHRNEEEKKETEIIPEIKQEEKTEVPVIELPVDNIISPLNTTGGKEQEVVTKDLSGNDDIQFTIEKKENSGELSADEIGAKSDDLVREFGEYDPTLDLSGYQFPSIELLENYASGSEPNVNTEELTLNKNRIVETLGNYGIAIEKIKATIGPTVTLYEIIPAAGVRISKIKNLEDDIALSLSALGIRIIAPIPGKGTIGIEVPNMNPEVVPMRALMASERFQNTGMDLPVALGKTIANEIFIADLGKMPHLLMAGATGQGKSVGLNAILVSLLYKKHPAQIKFVLVDPKKVELTLFNRIERHFLAKLPDSAEAIITDTKKVIHTLNSLCIEMDDRYNLLKEAQVRNIKEYNAKFIHRKLNPANGHKFLPYIVLVVDEFADLIMTAGKEVETPIARLAQLARAIGIHLIIATQRPSVNIITGTIKANFPSRIAFRVTSKIDSRTILDSGGAEQLIGKGDMLYSTGNDLIRLQCAFVDTPEVERITRFIGDQRGYPDAFLLPEYVDETADGKFEIDEGDRDSLFEEAARIVVNQQQGSASLLQRKLKLGYNRAGRIVDQLETAGIIGKFEGSKAREVLIKDLMALEEKLVQINTGKKGDVA